MNLYFVYILHYFETTNNQFRYNTKMYVQMKTATCQYRMYRKDATILTPYTNANIISSFNTHTLLLFVVAEPWSDQFCCYSVVKPPTQLAFNV